MTKTLETLNIQLKELTTGFHVFVYVGIFDGHFGATEHHWVENFRE